MAANITRSQLYAGVQALRCEQWIKNLFVFAPPMFGRQLLVPEQLSGAALTFVAFCLASSSTYIINDFVDIERDRAHPVKKDRPLASGRLSVGFAAMLGIVCALLALVISGVLVSKAVAGVIAAYVVANVAYSLVLKHVVILDVMFIAVGFILRILAGAVATAVQPSHWLLLCTLNVSLFLGFAKRRSEIVVLQDKAGDHREVLEHYSTAFIDQMVAIVTGATLVCYILYSVDEATVARFGTDQLILTVPFVMYGLFRYLYLSYHHTHGVNPAKTMLGDVSFLVNLALWGITCLYVIYWAREMP
ncbi:MAG: decaprenyl-phosphate phosphoribosyltransferase [Candidatus Hydrogenedentes bacterium]|nr:decaprenyl-phosphate phosphoribosyltransferase [Candidatus Hydrogenedentota bacterium]